MKSSVKIFWLWMALTLLALPGCGGARGLATTPTVDTAPIFTQIASTALALQTQTVLAAPTATNTPLPSPTPTVTDTPLPSTPSATLTIPVAPTVITASGCDNLQYNADVTIPDGSPVDPDVDIDKTWSVTNLGPCTWNENYTLAYYYGGDGTIWKSITPQRLGKVVLAGQTVDITITLRTPSPHGTYSAAFILQNDKGVDFPSASALTIKIVVQ